MDAKQTALAEVRGAWNAVAALFNPAITRAAAVPALKPVADIMRAVAAPAIAGADTVSEAIKAAGIQTTEQLTADEHTKLTAATAQIIDVLRSIESTTRFRVVGLIIDRNPDGTIKSGDVSLVA